ncbi:hypothetical protein [Shewanella frigidimarina]|uniref:Uncharacterized protein n=1 Tax=Shewanella frigidimarina TaxID=56812 RepID=A0A125BDY6_SHEFR|nr:hypothetical protein [Shewanella frigidimarina]KVX00128.1 hypothetical protein AWJ07_09950 [Shewanella frigidimarina]
MDKPTNVPRKMPWVAISVIASIVLLFGLLLMLMPKGFTSNLEQIGTGKPAVVFVYDPNLVSSITQTEQMNEARSHLGDNVYFLLARTATPEGDAFIAKHNARVTELFLFDSAGSLAERQLAVIDANELMRWVR